MVNHFLRRRPDSNCLYQVTAFGFFLFFTTLTSYRGLDLGLRQFSRRGPKSLLFSSLLRLLLFLRLNFIFSIKSVTELNEARNMKSIMSIRWFLKNHTDGEWLLVLLSPQSDRGRAYVYGIDHEANLKYFAKLSFNGNHMRLLHEKKVLNFLEMNNDDLQFMYPYLLDSSCSGEFFFIKTTTLPPKCKNISLLYCFLGYPNIYITRDVFFLTLSEILLRIPGRGYRSLSALKNSFFFDCLNLHAEELIPTCFAHGDYGPANIFECESRLFAIDFELSSRYLPIGYDFVSMLLGCNSFIIKVSPSFFLKYVRRRFYKYLLSFHKYAARNNNVDYIIAASLLIRYRMGFDDSYILMQAWGSQ